MMFAQKIVVSSAGWESIFSLLYAVRSDEPYLTNPRGASIYFSAPADFSGKVYAIDQSLFDESGDVIADGAILIDGGASDRFMSFEVDNLSSVLLYAPDGDVELSVVVRAWE